MATKPANASPIEKRRKMFEKKNKKQNSIHYVLLFSLNNALMITSQPYALSKLPTADVIRGIMSFNHYTAWLHRLYLFGVIKIQKYEPGLWEKEAVKSEIAMEREGGAEGFVGVSGSPLTPTWSPLFSVKVTSARPESLLPGSWRRLCESISWHDDLHTSDYVCTSDG